MYRVLVTGSRYHTDVDLIHGALEDLLEEHGKNLVIVTGGASGADALAYKFAVCNGLEAETYPADWGKHGKSAGPIRNQQMVDTAPDEVLAFPHGESRGTRGCIKMAEVAGLKVTIFEK